MEQKKVVYKKPVFYTDTHIYRDLMNFSRQVAESSKNVQIDLRKTTIQELINDCLRTAKYIRLSFDEVLNLEKKEKYIRYIIGSLKNIEVDFNFSKDLKVFSNKTAANLSFLLGKMCSQAQNWYISTHNKIQGKI